MGEVPLQCGSKLHSSPAASVLGERELKLGERVVPFHLEAQEVNLLLQTRIQRLQETTFLGHCGAARPRGASYNAREARCRDAHSSDGGQGRGVSAAGAACRNPPP